MYVKLVVIEYFTYFRYQFDETCFLCMLSVAVARSSSGGVVMRYVLPVKHIMTSERMGR